MMKLPHLLPQAINMETETSLGLNKKGEIMLWDR